MIQQFLKTQSTTPKKLGVVGDAMIDVYYNVNVKKISPEFPIPVMHSTEFDGLNLPGGAANVVNQFKNFNFKTSLFSFLDLESKNILIKNNINVENSSIIYNLIPRKIRFYSDDFPTYRWDVEKDNYGLPDIKTKTENYFQSIRNSLKNLDVVIFSDYEKGIFNCNNFDLIKDCKLSIVDPKGKDLSKWVGCTVFKPNAKEALYLSGENTIEKAAFKLKEVLKCEAVIITQASEGITLLDNDGLYCYKPKQINSEPVESVIGAGDCFVAFLAMGLAHNISYRDCLNLAWVACSNYVRNRHNKAVHPNDLLISVYDYSYKYLKEFSFLKKNNRDFKLVFTNGCFDLMHIGHIESLKYAKSLGDKLVVAVNTDASVAGLKPNRPILSLEQRIKMLSQFDFVDYIISFDSQNPFDLIKEIKPDVLVKGGEYEDKLDKYEDIVGCIQYNPMVEGISTSKIIEKIKSI